MLITGEVVAFDSAHYEIHEGEAFTACKVVTHGAGASPNILIVTPDLAVRAHFVFQVVSDDVLTVGFYGTSGYTGGSAVTAYNRNRNSSNTSELTLTKTATTGGVGKGTLIWTFKGGANKSVTNSESDRFEFILKQDTKYLLEAVGANGDLITILLDWYERNSPE